MKRLQESILDNDFDIQGIEYIYYDWFKWPITFNVSNKIKDINFGILGQNYKNVISKVADDLLKEHKEGVKSGIFEGENEGDGYLSKTICRALIAAASGAGNFGWGDHNPAQVRMAEQYSKILDEIFSQSGAANVMSKLGYNDGVISVKINEKTKNVTLRFIFYDKVKEKERQVIAKAIDKVCKKHNLEYEVDDSDRLGSWRYSTTIQTNIKYLS